MSIWFVNTNVLSHYLANTNIPIRIDILSGTEIIAFAIYAKSECQGIHLCFPGGQITKDRDGGRCKCTFIQKILAS